MAVTLRFSAAALLSCRFAISPLHETMSAVRQLAGPAPTGYHAPWLRAVEPVLETLDLTPLSLLAPRRSYGPDFLNPPPGGPATTFAAELAAVRATPAARVRREVGRCLRERFGARLPPSAAPLLRPGEHVREVCADTLQIAWEVLVEPWWPHIRGALEADIAFRSRLLADAGLAAVLTDLHPDLRWTGRTLHVAVNADDTADVGAAGIVLMPGVFTTLGVSYDPPAIDYLARGVAALWAGPAESPEPLVRLLGRRRADVLMELDVPASTTGLAARSHLPVSSVSEHLTVLREAGLVATHRTGRRLQHARTPLGTALVEGG